MYIAINTPRPFIFLFFALLINSCSHLPLKSPNLAFDTLEDLNSISKPNLNHKITTQEKSENVFHYWLLHSPNQKILVLPPNSKYSLSATTFCLNSKKGIPSKYELYSWKKYNRANNLLKKIINHQKNGKINREFAQKLIWKIKAKTYIENYSSKELSILSSIERNIYLILPSKPKADIKNLILKHVPFASNVKEIYTTVENNKKIFKNKIKTYEDFRSEILNISSKHPEQLYSKILPINGTKLYSSHISNSYYNQMITIYNPTRFYQELNLNEYYFSPRRKDIQDIGVFYTQNRPYSHKEELKALQKIYGKEAKKLLNLHWSTRLASNLYEATSGKDVVYQKPISKKKRAIALKNILTDSLALKSLARFTKAPLNKKAQVFKWLIKDAKRVIEYSPRLDVELLNLEEKLINE